MIASPAVASPEACPELAEGSRAGARPGLEIQKRMKARGWSRADLAFVCGRNISFVNKLISGRQRITARTAVLLGAAFQVPSSFWMDLALQYDLAPYALDEAKLAAIRERAAAHERGESIKPKRCAACGQRIRG